MPLFFVCVHTNVGYKVVAEFICQTKDAALINEALMIIRKRNSDWDPLYFKVDNSAAEISAIEKQFPDSKVFICDFHKIQAWQRWMRTTTNGLTSGQQQALIEDLQCVAYAGQQKQFEEAVEKLSTSEVYIRNSNVGIYIKNT